MVELGTHTPASKRRFVLGWVGMTVVMSFAVTAVDFLELSLQTVYVLAVGMALQGAIGLAAWALRR